MAVQITFDSDEDPIDSIDEDEEEEGGALRQLHNLKQVRPLCDPVFVICASILLAWWPAALLMAFLQRHRLPGPLFDAECCRVKTSLAAFLQCEISR
jgi:hypothetical protein